jgi:hypothetical protein
LLPTFPHVRVGSGCCRPLGGSLASLSGVPPQGGMAVAVDRLGPDRRWRQWQSRTMARADDRGGRGVGLIGGSKGGAQRPGWWRSCADRAPQRRGNLGGGLPEGG